MKVWLNNKFVDIDKATISIFDRGFLYGDGLFETMRSYAGIAFMIDRHLGRLYDGLKTLKVKEPCSKRRLNGLVMRAIAVNRLKSAYIRVAVTRGEGRFGITYKDDLRPNLVIVAKEFEGYPERMHRHGLSGMISGISQNERSPLSRVKTINFLPYILARLEAQDKGYDEAILTNTRGFITEASTSNIFLVKSASLITPSLDSGALPGITRGVIIGIARRLRIRVAERRVTRRELLAADEAFLTNSLAEVVPLVRVGPKRIGGGIPGVITKLLAVSYQKEVIRSTSF